MTWNQIYETIADALGKPLNALHVASDFLAGHGETYDFRGELLGDKAATVVFDNSKIKRLVPDFICTVSMVDDNPCIICLHILRVKRLIWSLISGVIG